MQKKILTIKFYKLDYIKLTKNSKQSEIDFSNEIKFEKHLNELAKDLDGNYESQIVEIGKDNLETSIWFDFLNEKKFFKFEETKYYYFLLAKDVKSLMKEDKKYNTLTHQDTVQENIHSKIPTHFIYFPEHKVLGVEESHNSPTKSILERIIKDKYKQKYHFKPIQRDGFLERLTAFTNAIEFVEISTKQIGKFVKNSETDERIDFIHKNPSLLQIKTYLDTEDEKKKVITTFKEKIGNFFNDTPEREMLDALENMKITFKNENLVNESIGLIDNVLTYKVEKEDEFPQHTEENSTQKRLEYSKNIYQIIINSYEELINN